MKTGTIEMARIVSRHSKPNMMTRVAVTVTTLATSVTKVLVTACCAPTTSLLRRDIISPVLVLVKKASDIRWR